MDKTEIAEIVAVCEAAARRGGQILLDHVGKFSVREKAPMDLVTDADLASERAIRQLVQQHFPDHAFIGEEGQGHGDESSSTDAIRWIVDPLDGTVNYVHGLQSYSVSVAVEQAGELLAGAVFDPLLDEMYIASCNQPATLNGSSINVSDCQQAERALVAVSLPAKSGRGDLETERMLALIESTQAVRRLGSAALNLCYVAAGRLDGYLATSLNAWDVAAGALILQRAGGTIRHIDASAFDLRDPRILAAATDSLWENLHASVQV